MQLSRSEQLDRNDAQIRVVLVPQKRTDALHISTKISFLKLKIDFIMNTLRVIGFLGQLLLLAGSDVFVCMDADQHLEGLSCFCFISEKKLKYLSAKKIPSTLLLELNTPRICQL